MIIVTALRTHAAATKTEELVAGRVGMEAAFHFSPEWDGLGKTAVFEAGGVAKDVIVGDDPCIVPHECMIEGAELRVGIYGMSTDGTIVIPTVYALVGTVKKGADPSGDESYPPTPDVGAQAVAAASTAMQAAAAAQEVAAEIQRRADAGEFDGAPGYTPIKGKDYFDGEPGYTPVKGKDYFDGEPGKDGDDYVLTEADKVEIAEIAADLVDVPEGKVELDTTLTQSGKAADAKAVGDALAELEAQIPESGGGVEEETDPTVPAWAKNPTKPSYTAAEVGAMEADAAVVKTVNGAAPDASGNVTVEAGGGGGEEWRLVRSVTLTEDAQAIDIDADDDGNPFALKKIRLIGDTQGTAASGQLRVNIENQADDRYSILGPYYNFKGLDTTKRCWMAQAEFVSFGVRIGKQAGLWKEEHNTPDSANTGAMFARATFRAPRLGGDYLQDRVEYLHIFSNTSTVQFAAGSTIELWGVDA